MTQDDKSNGYEEIADQFIASRNPVIGAETVRQWSTILPRSAAILDLGCGHGFPISQVLVDEGFTVYGIDTSPTMVAAFRKRFPDAHARCESVEESDFFGCQFDAVVAWGLMFLLAEDVQATLIRKVAHALKPGGRFLFTAPREIGQWADLKTGRQSISLGKAAYEDLLKTEGFAMEGEQLDGGSNYYYLAIRP